MRLVVFFMLVLLTNLASAQVLTKTIRGTVTDKETYQPLIGVKVLLLNSDPLKGAITDDEGKFRLENVPLGRHAIQLTYFGYETVTKANLDVSTKDIVLTIEMVESVQMLNQVEVKAHEKGEVLNKMATVSVRSFSVEESNRYAGSKNDVARMAQNYAGVQGADDSRNDIVIRGNSPAGVLFRMEGIDIPNPNHFARFGTTGGPVSMLNNNVLANSDFLTGAFPAEYGNAIAGVFDLKMRNGNNEKHEFMFQVGFNGAELMAEGPISKKKGSSYLVNYRYSTLALFQFIGINFGSTALPNYQDGSFKLNFPTKNGRTTVFGIAGNSFINILAEQADSSDLFALDYSNTYFNTNTGVVGANHRRRIGSNGYINFAVGMQTALNNIRNDTLDFDYENAFTTYGSFSRISRQTADVFYNHKFNARHRLKVGLHIDLFFLDLNDSTYSRSSKAFISLRDFKGDTFLYQPYIQYQLRPTEKIMVNIGVHGQGLTLNNDFVIEPRAGISWDFTMKDRLSFGYGLHSQIQPIELYFAKDIQNGIVTQPNKNLGFSKSHHLIIGYQHRFNYGINAKIETYYQYLFNIPVSAESSPYSILNFGADFATVVPSNLASDGTGENYGAELTLEKYLEKGVYFLVTASVYESFYTASNGETYNTAFNGNFTFNTLAGYEIRLGKNKNNSLTFDAKFTLNGGKRYTEILLDESIAAGMEIRDPNGIFESRFANYVRGDFRVAFKTVGKKITQEWALDMQNITNRRNIFFREYNEGSQSIKTTYQTGFLPIGQYRIYF